MPTIICDKCGEDAKCLRKEQLTKEPARPGQPLSQQASIGWRYYLDCPKCGSHIQEKLHNSYLDTPAGYN
jgi:hypothetical protein